jgi:hypothetical protein
MFFCNAIDDLTFLVLNLSLLFLQLKVDKLKLIDLCGTSSTEFTTVIYFIHIFSAHVSL